MRLAVTLLVLILTTAPTLALETLSEKHFKVEYTITPEEDCYTAGEKIYLNYVVYPKSSAYRILIGGEENNARTYYFQTDLNDAVWRLIVDYYQGGAWDEQMSGKKAQIDAKYFKTGTEEKGIDKITANLTATVPTCNVRLCEFVALAASCEDCESNALPNVTIKVANEVIFKNDIKIIRANLSELKETLKSEGLYSEEDFKNVSDLIDSAESYLLSKNYIKADEKLKMASDALKKLFDLSNKKVVEKMYIDVDSEVSKVQKLLMNSSVLLEKIKGSERYTDLALKQKEYEDALNSLKNNLKDAKNLIENGDYTKARSILEEVTTDVKSLKDTVEGLIDQITAETQKGGFIPSIALPFNPLYILASLAAVFLIIVVLIKIRRRKRWDELR
ncbi:MAG: hypothetical protein QFX40_05525 [Archaeoglobales archaeon]|nr:hypothetical protein [Archaeoglobales archaeon]